MVRVALFVFAICCPVWGSWVWAASSRPVTRPGIQSSTRLSTRSATQSSTQPSTQPATQASTRPGTQPTTQPKQALRWCRQMMSRVLYRGRAQKVLANSGLVALLHDKHRALSVRQARNGRLLWTTRLQKQPKGVHTLHMAGRYLVVYAGNRLFSFAARSGAFGGQRWVRFQRHLRHSAGCTFEYRRGVCGYSCGDEFQLLNCQTMYPMSDSYEITQTCFSRRGCFSFRGQVFGRVGDLLLATVEEPKRTSGASRERRRQVILAVHQKTGQVVWESEHNAVLLWMAKLSGISPDRKTCWMANYAGDLSVFDCRTGRELWNKRRIRLASPLTLVHRRIRWQAKPKGLLLQRRGQISLVKPRTGQVIWQKYLLPQTFALVQGGTWPKAYKVLKQRLTLQVVKAQDGEPLYHITIPAQRRVWVFPEGHVVVVHGRQMTWRYGRTTRKWMLPEPVLQLQHSRHGWVVGTKKHTYVLHKQTGQRLLVLAGTWQVKSLEDTLGDGRLLFFRSRGNKPDEVRLVELCLHPQ